MDGLAEDAIAVIFVSRRRSDDAEGYARAAAEMEREAAAQPGFLGLESARGPDGQGITVSYWESEAAVAAWRDHAGHAAVRGQGRADWYAEYHVVVAAVRRAYRWPAPGDQTAAT